jgi:hypothetical protein
VLAAVSTLVVGCGFDTSGASNAGALDDSSAIPIDSGEDGFVVDVPRIDSADSGTPIDSTPADTTTTIDTAPETLPDTRPPPPDVPPDTGPSCTETGAITWGGHCYFLITNAALVNWNTARGQCEGATPPAHLATMDVSGEHTVLESLCPAGHHCFIGLTSSRASKAAGDFGWYTGETGFDGPWCGGYPNNLGQCGSWWEAPPGCYQDLDCVATTHLNLICERD